MKKKSFPDAYDVIRYPLSTEKVIRQIEFDNRLTFVVHKKATKKDIKEAVEKLFAVKVADVNVQHAITGHKRAIVRLNKEHPASDVSADLGLI